MPALFVALIIAQAPTRLPETIVIESRQAAPLGEASPSVSRVNVTEATEAGLTTLAEALATTPGLYATEQTGEGSQASLFIRGTNSSQSAVLLDGRRLPPGFSGSYEIGRYRLFGLNSVEILRGPSSALYGANALGGVVDLRLASPLTEAAGGLWQAEGGSYGRGSLGFRWLANNAAGKAAATQGTSLALTTTHDDGWRTNGGRDATNALVKSEWRLTPISSSKSSARRTSPGPACRGNPAGRPPKATPTTGKRTLAGYSRLDCATRMTCSPRSPSGLTVARR